MARRPPRRPAPTLLQQARKALIQAQAERSAAGKLTAKERKKHERNIGLKKNAEIRAQLAQVRSLGLYSPRLEAGERIKLTSSRVKAIRRASRRAEALDKGAVFAPYPTRSKAQRKIIAGEITRRGGVVTKRGIFLPKSPGELKQPTGALRRDKATGAWEIVVQKRDTGGKIITEVRPLDEDAAFEGQVTALEKRVDALHLGKGERIRFQIGGPDGNTSTKSYKNLAELMREIPKYRATKGAQATFMRSLTIYVVTKETPRAREYNKPVAFATGRGRKEVTPLLLDTIEPRFKPMVSTATRKRRRTKRERIRGRK